MIDDLATVNPWAPRGVTVVATVVIEEDEGAPQVRSHPQVIISWGIDDTRPGILGMGRRTTQWSLRLPYDAVVGRRGLSRPPPVDGLCSYGVEKLRVPSGLTSALVGSTVTSTSGTGKANSGYFGWAVAR